jgi:hypothetical protein
MAATVTAKLALDSSGFTAGLTKAQAALGKLGAIGVPVMAAGFAAAAAAAAGLAVGIKKAVDIGGALSELSARTGVAAGELRVLQMAFERAGLSADKVGPAINKMQRAIIEAGQGSKTAQDALANLGLSVEQLSGLSPDKQFEAIGQAINGISNPAAQAAAAMQIFGRSGGEMLALFKDSGALGDAARAIGSQADLLTRNANLFDRASDILNTIGSKLEGFFVGVADQVVPAILPLLEAADGLDFAGLGQELGQAVAFGLTAITSGQIGNLFAAQLKLSGAEFVNLLTSGLVGLTAFLAQRMVDIPTDFATILGVVTKPEFWQGVGNGLLGAAQKFAAIINRAAAALLEAVSKVPGLGGAGNIAANFRGTADSLDASANQNLGEAGDLLSGPLAEVKARFSASFDNAINAAANAMQAAGDTIDTSELKSARDGIVNSISEQMRANQEAARARFEASKTQIPAMDEEFGKAAKEASGVITDSLQKVGGGGNFARFGSEASAELNESKKQTGLLGRIAEGIGAAVTASDRAITSLANTAFNGGKKTQWSRAELSNKTPSTLGTPHADPSPKWKLLDSPEIAAARDAVKRATEMKMPAPLVEAADAVNVPAPAVNVPAVNVPAPAVKMPSVSLPQIDVPRPEVNVPNAEFRQKEGTFGKLNALLPRLAMPELQMPQMPALRDQRVSAFPDLGGTSDIAAQHLRESQKQTSLLSRIAEKLAPQSMALMPA